MPSKWSRKNTGGVRPNYISAQLDSSYDAAIENIRTIQPEVYNTIQNLRANGATIANMPEIENAIRQLRMQLYLSGQFQNPELIRLSDRLVNIWDQLDYMSNSRGGKYNYKRKTKKTKMKRTKKGRKNTINHRR